MVRRRRLPEQHVTEGNAGIVGAENDVQASTAGPFASLQDRRWRSPFLEVDRELVVVVAHRAVFMLGARASNRSVRLRRLSQKRHSTTRWEGSGRFGAAWLAFGLS